ncbi:hypothetical protein LUZ60_002863 [Juncus effusus]|nr:hypothetical protein LUZ60_002863 [Juncus effusus]
MDAPPSATFPLLRRETPSDTLFYSLYPPLSPSLPAPTLLSALSSLHLQINALLSPFLSSYLFHRDSFSLSLCLSPLPHLSGKTHFADSISDEWFIVSLLFVVSRSFPDLVIKVWDSDGEFLLIEAAFYIPDWLDPETSANRVFVKNGELHIVPKEVYSKEQSLEEALKAARDERIETRASEQVQKSIQRKIEGYPDKARENMHRVRVRVPLKVAQVLKMEPCLISLAVEGFYDRDIDTMKHAARMEKFLKGENGEIEMVRVSVMMTRAMYGQLTQQRFQAPRGYPMPPTDNPHIYKEAELGLKITCGLEMMYQERRKDSEREKGSSTWMAFKRSLEKSGCFEGLLEGSKEYNRVLEEAEGYYKSTSLASRTREIIGAPVRRIDEILSLPYSSDDFKSIDLPPNDDDSWLYGGEEELDSEILEREREMEEYESKKKNKKEKKKKEDIGESSSTLNEFNLGEIAASMQEFVKKVSSFEGAEVPDDKNDVQIDADQFFKAMESVFNRQDEAEDEEESTSEMDFDDFGDDEEQSDDGNDDNDDDMFMESYSDALNKELSGSTVNKSFVRAEQSNNNQAASNEEAELTPVDVDFNLMKNFLDSFSSQQGLPGPASNLLGLMGLNMPPPDRDSEKKS